jgi:hypothetical protein
LGEKLMDFERLVEKHKENIAELSIMGFNLGVAEGTKAERNRIIREIDRQICFEYSTEGSCEHSSCWVLDSALKLVKAEFK